MNKCHGVKGTKKKMLGAMLSELCKQGENHVQKLPNNSFQKSTKTQNLFDNKHTGIGNWHFCNHSYPVVHSI